MDDRNRQHLRRAPDLHCGVRVFSNVSGQGSGGEIVDGRNNLFPVVLVAAASSFRRHDLAL
jgi:hypothetical protein